MLSVQILGPPRLLHGGHSLDLPRRKTRALLYYIAAHRRPLTREHLRALFWPDLDRAAGQQTLRATLHELRKALGDALRAERDALALAPAVEVDAHRFEDGLAPPQTDLERLSAALALYRGDLLDGFALPDGGEFDDWLAAERERYRRLAVRGLVAIAEQHEQRGRFGEALEALDRALAFDALQEDLQRAAMRLHYLAGDRTAAIRRYESLRKLLKSEMGVPPMAETRGVYDAIVNDALPDPLDRRVSARQPPEAAGRGPPSTSTLPFTGRQTELQTLRRLAEESTHGLALIEGEPGIGKTRLAEEFICASGALPIAGTARELEQVLPYQPIIEALRGLLSRPDWQTLAGSLRGNLLPVWQAEIARLLPELAVAPSPALRPARGADEGRLWEAINQLLRALARQRRVVVFFDDLHWADASTLGLLGYLVRQTAVAPIFFLGAARSVAPGSPLATLVQTLSRENLLARLSLARLAPEDVAAIARQLSQDYAYALASWLVPSSEGNPYILAELVRHAREDGLLRPGGMVNLSALSATPVVPQTVYSLIEARLARLSERARRVLDAAVAVGRDFEFEVVARTAALSESAALDALDELSAAGLVRPLDALRYTFDHSLTMEVAYRQIGELRHRLIHRRVAEALESIHQGRLDAVAGQLAFHLGEGGVPERAAPYALRAARQAARLSAWTEAAAFYEQALAAIAGDERVSILMALGEARFQEGQSGLAVAAFQEAATLADGAGKAAAGDAARLALAHSLLPQARYAQAIALAGEVLAAGRPDSAARAEFVWGTALSLEGADLAGAACHLEAAEALCRVHNPGDLVGLARIKFELGSVAAQRGALPEAIALYRESLAVAQRVEDDEVAPIHLVLAYNNLGYHLHLLHDPSAIEYANAGLRLAQEKGLLVFQPHLLSTLGEIALAANDLASAEQHFSEGLRLAEQLGIPERIAGLTANLGRVALAKGETALAVRQLSTALTRADALGIRHLATQIRLWLAPALPPAEARVRLAEAQETAEASGRHRLLEEIGRLRQELSLP